MKAENHIGLHLLAGKREQSNSLVQFFNKQTQHFEASRFGLMAIFIIIQSCIASIACMYIFQNKAGDLSFVTCTMLAMLCNSMFIAQAPAKWCLGSFYLSVLMNIIFIAVNL